MRLADASPADLVAARVTRKQQAREAVRKLVDIAIENQEPYVIGNISVMAVPADMLQLSAVFEALEQSGFRLESHSHVVQELVPLPGQDGQFVPKIHVSFVCRTVDGLPKRVVLA